MGTMKRLGILWGGVFEIVLIFRNGGYEKKISGGGLIDQPVHIQI